MEARIKLMSLRADLYKMIDQTPELTGTLVDLAEEIDEVFKAANKSKIVGASFAVGGGLMAGVGFVLTFCTFGAAFGLTIAGSTIAGLGAATVGIAQLVDFIHSSRRFKVAEKAINEYKNLNASLKEKILDVGAELELLGNINTDFKDWMKLIGKLVLGSGGALKGIGWNVIGNTILTATDIAQGITLGGSKAGLTAFRTAGTCTARAATHIASGVVGILLIPLDIYTLVDTSIIMHKKKPHTVAEEIRTMAGILYVDCPTRLEVDTAIENTLDGLECPRPSTSSLLVVRRPINAMEYVDLKEYYTL